MIGLLTFIKSPLFKYGLIIVITLSVVFSIYCAGQNSIQAKWDLAKANVETKIEIQKVIEEKITKQIDTVYVDRIKEIKVKGDTIVQYIPKYITKEDNDKCIVPTGFVRLWNSAVSNEVPGPATELDRGPADITLTDIEENAADNFTTCNKYIEQNAGLKEWIKQQKAANK